MCPFIAGLLYAYMLLKDRPDFTKYLTTTGKGFETGVPIERKDNTPQSTKQQKRGIHILRDAEAIEADRAAALWQNEAAEKTKADKRNVMLATLRDLRADLKECDEDEKPFYEEQIKRQKTLISEANL